MNLDPQTAAKLRLLSDAKARAVSTEDYLVAKQIKAVEPKTGPQLALLQSVLAMVRDPAARRGRRGVLIEAAPGVGKTSFLKLVGEATSDASEYADCSTLLELQVGDVERNIYAMFESARGKLLLWDNLDCLFSDGEAAFIAATATATATKQVPTFASLAFLHALEELDETQFIVATCSNAAALPPGFTLSSRLGTPKVLLLPNAFERRTMLHMLLVDSRLRVCREDEDCRNIDELCDELSLRTQGFSAGDVLQLVRTCIYDGLHLPGEGRQTCMVQIQASALLTQASIIQPSAVSQAPTRVSPLASLNLIGLEAEQDQLLRAVLVSGSLPALTRSCRGILIHGPSGSGKSSLAAWLAFQVRHRFRLVSVSCAELVHKVVGESERRIAACFQAARSMAPCLLLLDNLEIIIGSGGGGDEESQAPSRSQRASHPALDRLLSSLLVEIDGLGAPGSMDSCGQPVIVVATTANLRSLDKALTRPGRLEEHVALGLPNTQQRLALLQHLTSQLNPAVLEPLDDQTKASVLAGVARATDGQSQAEIINTVQGAFFSALSRFLQGEEKERKISLEELFEGVTSVSSC